MGKNIFADLGYPNAEEHFLKAQLVSRIYDTIKARKLTQVRAAKVLGIKQPDVSKMLNGHFREYSEGRLLRFLAALDKDVEIVVRESPRNANTE